MRKEQPSVALRACAYHLNRFGSKSGSQQLPAIGFDQIEMQIWAEGRVSRRALRQKEHGIFRLDRIGRIDLAKELAGVVELRFELRKHLLADGVATGANAGTYGGKEILRPGTEG